VSKWLEADLSDATNFILSIKIMENTFIDEISSNYRWITLTGMSGLGKSYWSKVLAAKGYKRFCCDETIKRAFINFTLGKKNLPPRLEQTP
jgi:hypothetical protein